MTPISLSDAEETTMSQTTKGAAFDRRSFFKRSARGRPSPRRLLW